MQDTILYHFTNINQAYGKGYDAGIQDKGHKFNNPINDLQRAYNRGYVEGLRVKNLS